MHARVNTWLYRIAIGAIAIRAAARIIRHAFEDPDYGNPTKWRSVTFDYGGNHKPAIYHPPPDAL